MATKADMQAAGTELLNALDKRSEALGKLQDAIQAQLDFDAADAAVTAASTRLKAVVDELAKRPTPPAPAPPASSSAS